MERRKSNTLSRYHLCLAAMLFAACMLLVVGSTLARYKTDITQSAAYAVKDAAAVRLWSLTDAGDLSANAAVWTDTEDGVKSLAFGISNGTKNNYASETQRVCIRLCASVGIGYDENILVELYAPDPDTGETAVYTASAKQIQPYSPLYNTFGEGWVFRFQNADGEEPSWTLAGNCFSAMTAEIMISGIKIDNPSLLQLQVEGDVSEK